MDVLQSLVTGNGAEAPRRAATRPLNSFVIGSHERFSLALRRALKRQYSGKLPSAAKIAREYNLQVGKADQISTETARKWLRGASLPRASRLLKLVQWLGDDLRDSLLEPNETLPSDFTAPNKSHARFSPTDRQAELIRLVLHLREEHQTLVHALLLAITRSGNPNGD